MTPCPNTPPPRPRDTSNLFRHLVLALIAYFAIALAIQILRN